MERNSPQPIGRTIDPGEVRARTELGCRLRQIRRRIVESGERLLSNQEVDCEVAIRRGGQDPHIS